MVIELGDSELFGLGGTTFFLAGEIVVPTLFWGGVLGSPKMDMIALSEIAF